MSVDVNRTGMGKALIPAMGLVVFGLAAAYALDPDPPDDGLVHWRGTVAPVMNAAGAADVSWEYAPPGTLRRGDIDGHVEETWTSHPGQPVRLRAQREDAGVVWIQLYRRTSGGWDLVCEDQGRYPVCDSG